ncbi:MAG: zinc-binding dehydrogenase [Actinomycetota bacterium]|nr:zinc-binding dehydrogenase [Actinomycetota bacterium]
MKAAIIKDGAVLWEERPDPQLGPDELLLRVEAAGINGADLLQRAGHYPPPAGVPADMPGLECAGVVEAVGERVRGFRPGERAMGLLAGAGQAELTTVHERLALRVPDGVGIVEAGGFPEVFCTAHDALFSQAALAMGERLLVTGAAGGVGMAAVQLGVAAGATVVASARDPELRARLGALGATCAGPAEALALGPFDVVLELVAGAGVGAALGALAPSGRVVVIGTGAGALAEVDLRTLMGKRAVLRGSTLRNRSLEDKALVVRQVERHVIPLVASGRVRVAVEAVFPFERAQEAYERFAAGKKFGKIVLARSERP